MEDRKISIDNGENDFMINKVPFLCSNPNLFDVFFLIGYEQEESSNEIVRNIEEIITNPSKAYKNTNLSSSFFSVYNPENFPVILNTICNNNERVSMLSEEEIISFTFPDPPSAYFYIVDPNEKETYEPNQYNVIFYLNNDTIDGKKKMTRSCFSFVFYEMICKKMQIKSDSIPSEINSSSQIAGYQTKGVRIFIPKSICFISEYPYFTQFEKTAKKILAFFTQIEYSIQVPVEIFIYNLINFTPCPIKSSINFTYFPEQFEINKDPDSVLTLQQLSGYPLFDFNFSEIFIILPIVTIAEIVICNILEIDMLFFSKNIEVLNIVMYIIAGLNYPCNDSNYHWFIVSLSQDEFENRSDKSLYMAKPGSAMLGVNCSYNESIKLRNFAYPVFVADLDNKEFFYKAERQQSCDNDDNDNEKTVKLIQYIHETIMTKTQTTNTHFEKSLIVLISELETKANKIINANANQSSQIVPKFLVWDSAVNITNRMIQELFYNFNLNIFQLFYKFTVLTNNPKSINKKKKKPNDFSIEFELKNLKLSFDEQALCDLISNSSKVNNFIRSFVQRSESQMEIYQIPMMFSEEFIQIKTTSQSNLNLKMSYFNVMDNFYDITPKNSENVNFNAFFKYYLSELKEEYNSYMSEAVNINLVKVSTHKSVFQYKFIELDKTILYKYMYFINNLSRNKLEELFPSIIIQKRNMEIESVSSYSVPQYIENSLLTTRLLSVSDLISISFVMFYGFIIEQNKFMSLKEFGILSIFKNINHCRRKYVHIIFDLLLRMYAKTQSRWIMSNLNELTGFILKENLIPNKLMMNLLEQYSILKKQTNIKKSNEIEGSTSTSTITSTPTSTLNQQLTNELIQTQSTNDSNTNQKEERNQTPQNNESSSDIIKDGLSDEYQNIIAYNSSSNTKQKYLMHLKKNNCRNGNVKEDKIMKYADNSLYDGDLIIKCHECNSEIKPMFSINLKTKIIESNIFSPLKIFKTLLNLYRKKYYKNVSLELFTKEDYDMLSKISLILLFYLNNIKLELDKEEKGAFEYLLTLHLEEYYNRSLN